MPLDHVVAQQIGQEPRAAGAGEVVKPLFGHGPRLIVGPRSLHLLLHAEPLGEVDLAPVDARQQVSNRIDAKTSILKLGDELEPVDVRRPVVGDPTADLGRHERPARLVEPDRPARDLGGRSELVNRVLGPLRIGGRAHVRRGCHF